MAVASTKAPTTKTVKASKPKTKTTETGATKEIFEGVEDLGATARDQMEKLVGEFSSNAEDMREQFEDFSAAVQDSLGRTRGFLTDVSSELAEAAREEVTSSVQFANDLANAKTFSDALDIQRTYWTNIFEARADRARELTERSVEVARESMEPFTAKSSAFFENGAFEKMFRFPTKA